MWTAMQLRPVKSSTQNPHIGCGTRASARETQYVALAQRKESEDTAGSGCNTVSAPSIGRRDSVLALTALSLAVQQPATAGQAGWVYTPRDTSSTPRTVFITGANSGIGFAAAGRLAMAGDAVVLACRTNAKAEKACKELQEQYGPLKGSVTPEECDLASLQSIRDCAERWLESGRPIDVLCLNAGAQFVGLETPLRSADGFELTVGVNHLGHFLLANLLLPCVAASMTQQPRIVVTASEVHDPVSPGGKIGPGATLGELSGFREGSDFNMVSGGPWDADKAYKDSKLCNVLFARELARRLQECGSPITVNAFGPGLITRTGFFRNSPGSFIGAFDFITNDVLGVAETVQGGGDCLAYMAAEPSLKSTGVYYNNMTTGIPAISPGHSFIEKEPSTEAQNAQEGKLLWELSAKLVGISPDGIKLESDIVNPGLVLPMPV